jgi:hypothetical protein
MIIHQAGSAAPETDDGYLRAVFEQALAGIGQVAWMLP